MMAFGRSSLVFAGCSFAIFLLFREFSCAAEASPELENIVQDNTLLELKTGDPSLDLENIAKDRLLLEFKPECNQLEATKRVLIATLELERREENSDINFDIQPISEGDFPAYSRTSFLKTTRNSDSLGDYVFAECTLLQTDLKHVGISIISMENCREIKAQYLKHTFEEDICVNAVEFDSFMTIQELPSLRVTNASQNIEESTEYAKESFMPVSVETADKSDQSSEQFTYWIDIIDAPKAWKVSKCKPSVVVGVIDTGVDVTHQNLRPNIWVNPGEIPNNGIDDDNNGFVDDVNGYDFYSHTGAVTDPNGHGTHCAGIIGASSPGADTGNGISGVCQHVSIAGLRFMSPTGSGATSSAIEALNYAAQMKFALTSNSWGSSSPASMLEIAIRNVNELGQIFIAAAGNDGRNTDYNSHYPSSYSLSNIVSVAATDSKDTLASFSNYGTRTVHIAAPGVQIWSTYPGGQLGYKSGTSMATPVIAGVVAMILSVCKLKPIDVRKLLMRTADAISKLNGRVASGGRVNAFKALMELDPDNCQDTES